MIRPPNRTAWENERVFVDVVGDIKTWFSASEVMEAGNLGRRTVYRLLEYHVSAGGLEIALAMQGGNRGTANLYRVIEELIPRREPESDKQARLRRAEWAKQLDTWTRKQNHPWTTRRAADALKIPYMFCDRYVKNQEALGLFVIEKQPIRNRPNSTMYMACEHRLDDSTLTVFKAIMEVGHDEDFEPTKPKTSTAIPPGTLERVAIYRERVEHGEAVWHPDDTGWHVRTPETKNNRDDERWIWVPSIREISTK